MSVGAQVAGKVEKTYSPPAVADFGAKVEEAGKAIAVVEEKIKAGESVELKAELADLQKQQKDYRMSQLKAMNWKGLWSFPAVFAAVILGLFLVVFRDRVAPKNTAES